MSDYAVLLIGEDVIRVIKGLLKIEIVRKI